MFGNDNENCIFGLSGISQRVGFKRQVAHGCSSFFANFLFGTFESFDKK